MVTSIARAREAVLLPVIGLGELTIVRFVPNPQNPTGNFLLDVRLPPATTDGKVVKQLTVVMYEGRDDGSDPSLSPVVFTHIFQFPPLLNALVRSYGPDSGIGAAAGQIIHNISLQRSARTDHVQYVAAAGDDGEDSWTGIGRP